MGGQLLSGAMYVELCIQRPVFFRYKRIDLFLTVTDHTQRDRLHTTGAESSLDLRPEKRADEVTHHTVEHTSRLLCIHQIFIDGTRLF